MTQTISLTPRLTALYEEYLAADKDYDIIWDTCCDHGYLGQRILANQPRGQIVFVDQVITITKRLSQCLQSQPHTNYHVLTQDITELKLAVDKSHLVFIAGIGGKLIAEILPSLLANNKSPIDFIFCPSTSVYSLRNYLSNHSFSLLSEKIVTDNNRFYEVIRVRFEADRNDSVSLLGLMWDGNNSAHHQYLKNLVTLYQTRLMGSKSVAAEEILALYQRCYRDNFT
jgi:tRNA (adenine22-N1)-methyltransferase